jgi:hypothetical protein
MREVENEMIETKGKMDEEKQDKKDHEVQAIRRLGNLWSRSSSLLSSSTPSTHSMVIDLPVPNPPCKLSDSGRPSIALTEEYY